MLPGNTTETSSEGRSAKAEDGGMAQNAQNAMARTMAPVARPRIERWIRFASGLIPSMIRVWPGKFIP